MFKKFFLSLLLILLFSTYSLAMPRMINFQGRILQPNGDPVTTGADVHFYLYPDPVSESTTLWDETQTSVSPDAQGVFSVVLGKNTPINIDASQDNLWLKIVWGGMVFTPKQRLVAVPYAFYAISAETTINVKGGILTTKSNAVGIGTTEPSATLEVKGTVKMIGNTTHIQTIPFSADHQVINGAIVPTDGFIYVFTSSPSCPAGYYINGVIQARTPQSGAFAGLSPFYFSNQDADYEYINLTSAYFMFPIKKGNDFDIRLDFYAGSRTDIFPTTYIYFTPLGQ
jgi:hypothetical protein